MQEAIQITGLVSNLGAGWQPDGQVLAQGIIRVTVPTFLAQLTTFRIRNSPDAATSATWLGRFGSFFFGSLWEIYVKDKLDT